MTKANRREFLISSAPFVTAPLILPMLSTEIVASPTHDPMSAAFALTIQSNWRWCTKCYMLFWNGDPNQGPCAAGGGHDPGASGLKNYYLHAGDRSVDLFDSAKLQTKWRYCTKCHGLFFEGYSPKLGVCAAGGAHNGMGLYFAMQHDIPNGVNNQGGWRFCSKCFAMVWDAYPTKGSCPVGGGHAAQGYEFVLPNNFRPDFHVRTNVTTDGWAPIGGWVDISAKQNGDVVFSGHIHNSGAVSIDFALAAVLFAPAGQSFAFAAQGRADGTQVIFGRERDYNWNHPKNDPTVAFAWNQFSNAVLATRLVASAAIGNDINRFLDGMAREFYELKQNPIALNAAGFGIHPSLFLVVLVK
jgi:hypothetical protein